jgi:hypothetical protein
MKKAWIPHVYPAPLPPNQGGRNQMEWPADFKWNRWPESRGMGGRLRMESVAGLDWNTQAKSSMAHVPFLLLQIFEISTIFFNTLFE